MTTEELAIPICRGGGEDPMCIARAYPLKNEFNFPALEDAESIQLAASMLFHAIAQGHIHLRRARLLRDMLRVAAMSCRLNKPNPDVTTSAVRDLDHTPEGVAIAPADPPSQPADSAPVQSNVAERPAPSVAEDCQLSASEPHPPGRNSPRIKILPVTLWVTIICQNRPA